MNIPLRIFDRNQGEKERTRDRYPRTPSGCGTRRRRRCSATSIRPTSRCSAASNLLKPYRRQYLKTATDVRDTMSFSYQRGQAALVDYLDAQRDYRAVRVAYLNLVGAYLTAEGQLSLAVGREVNP